MLFIVVFSIFVARAVSAHLSECYVDEPIRANADLQKYASCQVIKGDIRIEDFIDPIISFDRLTSIEGSLEIRNSNCLIRLESPELSVIGKDFVIKELTALSLIAFPKLKSVSTLHWKIVPLLSTVVFDDSIGNIEDITISDTSLTGFSGLQTSKLKNLNINNNRFLDTIYSNVEEITGMLEITSNSESLIVDLPGLTAVRNFSISNVKALHITNLTLVRETMSLYSNYFTELELPQLQKIGGTLSVIGNQNLLKNNFDSLKEINGGLMVINNTQIEHLTFLPKLTLIDGGIELIGNFETIEFDDLKLIRGSAKIQSSKKAFDCSKFVKDQLALTLRGGKVECGAIEPSPTLSPTATSKVVSTSPGSHSKPSRATVIVASLLFASLTGIA